jgi:hypothetical protein
VKTTSKPSFAFLVLMLFAAVGAGLLDATVWTYT